MANSYSGMPLSHSIGTKSHSRVSLSHSLVTKSHSGITPGYSEVTNSRSGVSRSHFLVRNSQSDVYYYVFSAFFLVFLKKGAMSSAMAFRPDTLSWFFFTAS